MLVVVGIVVVLLLAVLGWRIYESLPRQSLPPPFSGRREASCKTLVVLGSGGHTSEMLRLLAVLPKERYTPRHYIISDTDNMSMSKLKSHEGESTEWTSSLIPRAREVNQSYLTSVYTTLKALFAIIPAVWTCKPDLVLVNGPGTCIPVCCVAYLLRIFGTKRPTIVYVESICRVSTLSLSGKILYYFADHLLVQWDELHKAYPKAQFIGRIS